MNIDDIIAKTPKMGTKRDEKNFKKGKKEVRKDFKKAKKEDNALDRIMDDMNQHIQNSALVEEEKDIPEVGEREIRSFHPEASDNTEEEYYDGTTEDEDDVEEPSYWINDKNRICIGDPYIGVKTFSTYMEDSGEMFDSDMLGELMMLTLFEVAANKTPYFIAKRSVVMSAFMNAGITDIDTSRFFIVDPFKEYDMDSRVLGIHITEDDYGDWNDIMDVLVDSMPDSAIVKILLTIFKSFRDSNFSTVVSDEEFRIITSNGEFNRLDDFIEVLSNDKDTVFGAPTDFNEDIFIGRDRYDIELANLFGVTDEESEGADQDHEPFSRNDGGGQGTDGYGNDDDREDDEGEEGKEEDEEKEKEEEKEEDGSSMGEDDLRELDEAFEEIQ